MTRKYLTSVEERLRQALRRAHIAEAKLAEATKVELSPDDAAAAQPTASANLVSPGGPSPDLALTTSSTHESEPSRAYSVQDDVAINLSAYHPSGDLPSSDWQYHGGDRAPGSDNASPSTLPYAPAQQHSGDRNELEAAPTDADDFAWDEQSPKAVPPMYHTPTGDPDQSVTDGMASLSVEEQGSGYLGVASGAAMLRLLLPDADHKRPSRRATNSQYDDSQDSSNQMNDAWVPTPVYAERGIAEIDLDGAINSYFSLYHQSYPIVHEPSFRAQYAKVLSRPGGKSWNALAYLIGAIGIFTTATAPSSRDLDLFEAAKANISIDSLETGNLTLVQVLVLMSNYLQKRNKPNSGYNYLGLALHMAMGLGLHKEFQDWGISPLRLEIRRRVWWCLQIFYTGAVITFGRPLSWPGHGIEVALPLNVDDRNLTHLSTQLPPPQDGPTTHSAVAIQARFHLATNDIYSRVISLHFPSAAELVRLDDERIEPWRLRWHPGKLVLPLKFRLSRSIMEWRYRNFRIICYRPFVMRHVLQRRANIYNQPEDAATLTAIHRCLHEAERSIASIHTYWMTENRNCLSAWYGLYFLFQASLIPVMCLRNDPVSPQADSWRSQIQLCISVLESMKPINPASQECHRMIMRLCSAYLGDVTDSAAFLHEVQPVEESPQTQLSAVYPMLWPQPQGDMDIFMDETQWSAFLSMPSVSEEPELVQGQDHQGA